MTLYELFNKLHYNRYYEMFNNGISATNKKPIFENYILCEPYWENSLEEAKTFDPFYISDVSFPKRDLKEIDPITKIPLIYKKYEVLHYKIVDVNGLKNTVYKNDKWDDNDYAAHAEPTLLILIS